MHSRRQPETDGNAPTRRLIQASALWIVTQPCAITRAARRRNLLQINAGGVDFQLHSKGPEQVPTMKTIFAVIIAGTLFSLGIAQLHSDEPKADQLSPETVKLIDSVDGPALYKSYCAVCHGTDARGGGPMAMSFKLPPPDLTRIATRNGGVYPQARVERIISGEEFLPGGHGTRTMPVWGPIFSQIAWDQDLGRIRLHNLAIYLGRLQAR
jgi:mono/diheme cytochrome c family protein